MDLFDVVVVGGITWFLIHNIFYSPKAQIRILLRQMFNIPIKLARIKSKFGDENNYLYDNCKKALDIRYKVIVALIDYYFDPEEDTEYIKDKISFAKAYLEMVDEIFLKK